ncbi:uncharacterized protein LOC119722735 [Patiria miniata]|uniref:Uncharacterized protein n=1 Tax=Patiria miniata TaxID=46514 RepID=A0A913ZB04_PATMI|nr:uncharacterized protein LOC119722735 [Patiria miniata]
MGLCWTCLTFATIMYAICGSARSKMKTLHFGPVSPSAPGEEFDKRLWLKSAMPRGQDRCPKMDDHQSVSQDHMTTESIQAACAVITTDSSATPYPEQGQFSSSLERLEFTLQSAGNIRVDLYGANNQHLFSLELRRFSSTIYRRYGEWDSDYVGTGIEWANGRFWISSSTSKLQVGGDGSDDPMISFDHSSGSHDIRKIGLYSDEYADWTIFTPCN